MANLPPERTGLPFVVFISQKGGAKYDVRVKVASAPKIRPSQTVTVALRPSFRVVRGRLDPRDLDVLRHWLEISEQVIVDYWNGDIEYTEDVLRALRPMSTERAGSHRVKYDAAKQWPWVNGGIAARELFPLGLLPN